MKKIRSNRNPALLAAFAAMALIIVAYNPVGSGVAAIGQGRELASNSKGPGLQPSRERLSGTLELAYPLVLAGEHQAMTIAITNESREEAQVITLQEGLASGALELDVVDAEGNVLPPTFDIERVPRQPEALVGLAPGDTLSWPDIRTDHLALDMSKPGRYRIRARIPTREDLLVVEQDLTILAPRDVRTTETLAVPLEDAPWAGRDEEGRIEMVNLERQWWLFYLRVDEYGLVAVVRLARLSSEPELLVDGGIERLLVRFVDAEGERRLLCIDPQDGTELDCEG